MFPGLTTKLSEDVVASSTTITITADLMRVTGSTAIKTLLPGVCFGGGFSGMVILVATSGTLNLLTTGNIAVAVTMAQNQSVLMSYSASQSTWYPGAIS